MSDLLTNADFRRIPIVGDDIYQVGQVLDILATPCAVDPVIAVTGFFSYLPRLAWSLTKPTPFDNAVDRIGRRHKRRRYRRFDIHTIDLPDAVGKPGLQRVMFTLGTAAERIGWYWLVMDATTDFAVNWTSMAYEWSGCQVEGAAQAATYRFNPQYLAHTGGTTQYAFDTLGDHHLWVPSFTGINAGTIGPKTVNMMVQFELGGRPGSVEPSNVKLVEQSLLGRNEVPMDLLPREAGDPFTYTQQVFSFNGTEAAKTYFVEYDAPAGWVLLTKGQMTGNGTLDKGFKFDP